MSNCIYCGKSAGLFSKSHRDCELKYIQGREQIVEEITKYFQSKHSKDIGQKVNSIAESSFISPQNLKKMIIQLYDGAVDVYLEDGVLSELEIDILDKYEAIFNISSAELNEAGITNKIVKNLVLQDVIKGDIKANRIHLNDNPFLFEKDEIAIWFFEDVELYELITKTKIVGGSHGASIKIAKGLYYRTSSFKGEPIKTEESKLTAVGSFVLTNKNIYFGSPRKTLKIKYSQIISMPTFSDAIGIQQSRANSKPLYFKNIDVGFVFNVISNLKND
ncbi:MAG: hypothetical protein RBS07_10260 [Lentimicrobium sp.]|jgi:hypothetical protein|nr:hypothetical protein [Lentimicrobium sp.]